MVRSNALVLATAAVALAGCASSEGTGPGQTMAGGTAAVIAGSAGAGTSGASLGGALGGGGALGAAGGGAAGDGAAGGGGGAVGAAGGDAAGGSGAAAGGGGQTGDGGTAGGSAGGGGGGAGGAPGCMPVAPATDGTEYCANGRGLIGSSGYSYELWSANAGSGCMRVPAVEGNYSATWTAAADFLARTGLVFDATKKHAQVGTITAQFEHNFTEVPVQGATSKIYVALYGWTLEPLMEYYVIEDHGDFVPGPTASDGSPRTNYGSLSVDDGTYDIWALPVKNRPSIIGDSSNFTQIFNVRRERRKCGKISVSEHLAKWDAVGLTLGKLEEAMFLMEAQNNSGTISVKASVTVK